MTELDFEPVQESSHLMVKLQKCFSALSWDVAVWVSTHAMQMCPDPSFCMLTVGSLQEEIPSWLNSPRLTFLPCSLLSGFTCAFLQSQNSLVINRTVVFWQDGVFFCHQGGEVILTVWITSNCSEEERRVTTWLFKIYFRSNNSDLRKKLHHHWMNFRFSWVVCSSPPLPNEQN